MRLVAKDALRPRAEHVVSAWDRLHARRSLSDAAASTKTNPRALSHSLGNKKPTTPIGAQNGANAELSSYNGAHNNCWKYLELQILSTFFWIGNLKNRFCFIWQKLRSFYNMLAKSEKM